MVIPLTNVKYNFIPTIIIKVVAILNSFTNEIYSRYINSFSTICPQRKHQTLKLNQLLFAELIL